MQPTASIITIGDELLLGQVVDTNSAFIGATAADHGLRVREIRSISDQSDAIKRAIGEAIERFDVIIITGGLGPTKDDITKRSIAELFGVDMVRDSQTYQFVRQMLTQRGVEFNSLNEQQADIPRGFRALPNPVGTAPGLFYNHNGRLLFCLPGVPFEMKKLFTNEVLPIIDEHFALQQVIRRTVLTYGKPESELAALLDGWESALPDFLSLAYLPNPRGLRLRLTSQTEVGLAQIDSQFETLQTLIPDFYLGDEPTSIEEQLSEQLIERAETLSIAESCTGGAISATCTALSGASRWYNGGVTAYSNEVKTNVLGVNKQLIEEHGAVSEQVATAMAQGVRQITGSTYGVATSGIAGPTGGTDEKPVGTVCIAIASKNGVQAYTRNFGQPRDVFIQRASTAALNYLRLGIKKGVMIIVLALLTTVASAQQRTLGEMFERLMTINYTLQIGEAQVEKAKVNHTAAPFLPSLAATATQQQNFGDLRTDNLAIGAQFRWRLFDGVGMFYRYENSKENLRAEELRHISRIEEMVADLSARYYYIISMENQIRLRVHSLKLSRERYLEAKSKYTIGAGSGLEMRLAGADLNADSSSLIKARESLDLAYIELNRILIYPSEDRMYVRDTISLIALPGKDQIEERTISQNTDILLAQSGEKINNLALQTARSARYPTLDFAAAYNIGLASAMPAANFTGVQGGSWGFSIGVNIFDGLETNRKIKSAKIDNRIAQINSADVENRVLAMLATELASYANSLTLAELENQNADAMELNMEIAMERYRIGDLSGIDLRNIQLQYLSAIERKISTLYGAKVSQIELLRISGDLL